MKSITAPPPIPDIQKVDVSIPAPSYENRLLDTLMRFENYVLAEQGRSPDFKVWEFDLAVSGRYTIEHDIRPDRWVIWTGRTKTLNDVLRVKHGEDVPGLNAVEIQAGCPVTIPGLTSQVAFHNPNPVSSLHVFVTAVSVVDFDIFLQCPGFPGTGKAVEFDALTTIINCGSDIDIDDIADNAFTAELWVRLDGWGGGGTGRLFDKSALDGWRVYVTSGSGIVVQVYCLNINAFSALSEASLHPDSKWHHIVVFFDDAGDRKIYIAIDGLWASTYSIQTAGVGVIASDAVRNLLIGNVAGNIRGLDGAIAWAAISNNDRYNHETDFIPPREFPADDVNYLASWPMDEGTGIAIDNIGNQGGAGSGAANRDGTLANGSWSDI